VYIDSFRLKLKGEFCGGTVISGDLKAGCLEIPGQGAHAYTADAQKIYLPNGIQINHCL
jgi:hypothetical protein